MPRLPGACRHFLLPSLLLPLFGALAWAGLSHVLPLTAALILWPLLALVIGMLAAQRASRSLSHALLPLRNAIDEVRVKGDLGARSGLKGPGVIDTLGTELDNALASLQGIISQVYFNATELAAASLQMAEGAQQICDRSRRQSDTAERTAATLEEMTGSIDLVASHASEASDLAGRASALSGDGSRMVDEAAGEFARIVDSVGDSAAQVRRLGERSQAIGQVVNVIRDIADQTNLLALNAAIEAARAGESGRGFAVVADEVRKLAERTSAATGEIAQTIQAIQHETDTAVSAIGDSASQAAHGAATARSAAEMLERIRRQVEETRQRIASIADATREQAASSRHIVADMSHITEDIQGNHAASQQTLGLAERQARMADNLKEVGVVFKLGRKGEEALRTHAGMPALARQAAEAAGQAFEQALKTGRIDAERLFSLNYTPIPNTEPKKFHTPSDGLADELLPGIQEALLERNGAMVYAIAADRNGYVPTHNQRFSQPLTGDPARDLLLNRTKRIFSDPVGKRVGEHELPYLLQTYRRDTGEIMHDVSAPIYVQGRHWGGFRIGYRTDQV